MREFRTADRRLIRKTMASVLLGLVAGVSLAAPIDLVLGIEIYFASLFLYSALQIGGWRLAAGIAVIVHAAGVALQLESLLQAGLSLLEYLCVILWTLRKKKGYLTPVMLFWLIAGLPSFLLMPVLTDNALTPMLMLQMVVIVVNAMFNALAIDVCSTYVPYLRAKGAGRVRLARVLFDLMVFSIIGSSFLFIINTGQIAERNMMSEMNDQADLTSSLIENTYNQWSDDEREALELRSLLQIGYLQEIIRQASGTTVDQAALFDDDGTLMRGMNFEAVNRALQWLGEGKWRPLTGELSRWESEAPASELPDTYRRDAAYVYRLELAPYTVLLRMSTEKYEHEAVIYFLSQSVNVLYIALTIGFLAFFLHRFVIRSIRLLAAMTTDLPQQIRSAKSTEWFDSNIEEIHILVQNFSFVTEKLKQMLREFRNLAHHDPLTGLSNRRHFNEFVHEELDMRDAALQAAAYMFIDLDRFKPINDKYGHAAGDELLVQVANRLRALAGEEAFIARLGGDEFVIVLLNREEADVRALAVAVRAILHEPFALTQEEVTIGGSIGISLYPQDGNHAEALIKHADIAMYVAKEQRQSSYVFYGEIKSRPTSRLLNLKHELPLAIEQQEIMLHYQPIVDARSGQPVMMEALARWFHPDHGYISPLQFIPAVEQNGMMGLLGEHVLRLACMQAKAWMDEGYAELRISINLSKSQLAQDAIADLIERTLQETGLPASMLDIEVTEEAFAHELDQVVATLRRLREQGIVIWLDDFGTGYSSLHLLDRLPIDGIKLDRDFARRLTEENRAFAIVRHLTNLAAEQGWQVIGEGIEDEIAGQLLAKAGCTLHQGYHYGKPMSADRLAAWLQGQKGNAKGGVADETN
ncbi:diguanylate cyclase (GGDEF)-like protein [Paenibacillus methanolicus]|uniref:Diguanylate cyclase (GGDEF)-like protein n=2 Tax=Paenibacillus methanolicus TaxID=582686 RepID=A0A5S5CL05_9BACL|nr:diguanylate cyclase (GGDEF)-like protein [Paenibacillus methanolicus]